MPSNSYDPTADLEAQAKQLSKEIEAAEVSSAAKAPTTGRQVVVVQQQSAKYEFTAQDYPPTINEDGNYVAPARLRISLPAGKDENGERVFIPMHFPHKIDPTGTAVNAQYIAPKTANYYHRIIKQMKAKGLKEHRMVVECELVWTIDEESQAPVLEDFDIFDM